MKRQQIRLLADHGWVTVGGTDQSCAKCQKPVSGSAVMHPRTFRHLHVECAMAVSGLRNVELAAGSVPA